MQQAWPLVMVAVWRMNAPGCPSAQMARPGLIVPGPGPDPQCRCWGALPWLRWRLGLPLVWGGAWGWSWSWLITGGRELDWGRLA